MVGRASEVVTSFKSLTDNEQTAAYLEIDAHWKNMQEEEPVDRPVSVTAPALLPREPEIY
jgi:hypothetical protein